MNRKIRMIGLLTLRSESVTLIITKLSIKNKNF